MTVRLPVRISPDLYFIGFVVTPQASSDRRRHGHQPDRLVPHHRRARAPVARALGRPRRTELRVRFAHARHRPDPQRRSRVGTVLGRERHDLEPWFGHPDAAAHRQVAAPGRHRPLVHRQRQAVVADRVRHDEDPPQYPDRDGSSTKELVATQRVLVANPVACAVMLVALTGGGLAWQWRRRRRRRRGRGRSFFTFAR